MWYTSCPPSRPSLITMRYPLVRFCSAATFLATIRRWPSNYKTRNINNKIIISTLVKWMQPFHVIFLDRLALDHKILSRTQVLHSSHALKLYFLIIAATKKPTLLHYLLTAGPVDQLIKEAVI